MDKEHSYSIWLMPTGRINKKLSKIILELSKKHKSPKFKHPYYAPLPQLKKFINIPKKSI